MGNAFTRHPLIQTLLGLRGNQRYCVYTEPLWGIPYNLIAPFISVYMFSLGVKDAQIGYLVSIGLLCQVIFALFGGIITDKMGRKHTTFFYDFIAWSIPCLIWAFSQNFWWFLTATIINSCWQITNNSWQCLLVEDCEPKLLVDIYTLISISGLLAVFFAPISGAFVQRFSVVPTIRVLYGFAFASMSVKFIVLNVYAKETRQGLIRMEETKHEKVSAMLLQYASVFRKIIGSPAILLTFAVMLSYSITNTVTSTFFGLYLTKTLLIHEQFLAYFPMARAAVMLVFLFCVQPFIARLPIRKPMIVGLLLYMSGQIILLLAPLSGMPVLIIYILLEAMGAALVMPRKDSMLALFADPQERSRIQALIYVIMIAVTAPFGAIGGVLSSVNRTYPFILNLCVFTLCLSLVLTSKILKVQS